MIEDVSGFLECNVELLSMDVELAELLGYSI
ncbi:unnamed protein product, partial [marine sediment metagenome]